jgi:molybdopterin-guanine dinucleotide biosynthesis adapter protein
MKVIDFAGFSGSGKTTLIEALRPALKSRGLRVSVVKHAHHKFDIDHAGKDTFRHREAGAFEVVVASSKRLALLREFEHNAQMDVHQLIAQLYEGVDWVLVEGFKTSDLLKIEVWRESTGKPALYASDPYIVAIATDTPAPVREGTQRPVLDLGSAEAVAQWLVDNGERFTYNPDIY